MRRFAQALALLAALTFVATACASSKATGLPAGPTEEPTTAECGIIEMTDSPLAFVPEECSVKVGATVTWENASLLHTVTAEPDSPIQFDSGNIEGGGEFTFTFEEAGVVPYYCKAHTSPGLRRPGTMIGTITVEAA